MLVPAEMPKRKSRLKLITWTGGVRVKLSLCFIGVFALFAITVRSQTVPILRPPDQKYIYVFNSSAVSATAPSSPGLNLGASFSIEFWIMFSRGAREAQHMPVFDKGIPTAGDPYAAYHMDFAPGTHQLLYFQSTGNPGSDRGGQIAQSLTPGQWYHVAIVSDNLQVTLYLYGQQQTRFTAAGLPPATILPLKLSGGFPGSLRQFRIWSRALQPVEITSMATKALNGTEAGLLADWPLDDGQGETLRDLGPNHIPMQVTHAYIDSPVFYPNWLRTAIVDGGSYFQVQRFAVPAINPAIYTIPIDFDSDGNIDLLVCQNFLSTVQPCAAFRNDGKGNFTDVTLRVLGATPPTFETPRDYCVTDFNRDGRSDVFIANTGECPGCDASGGQSVLLMQTPDGRLEHATAIAGLPQRRIYTHNVACGDIDGDGYIDILYMNQFPGTSNVPPQLFLNDGQAHFMLGESSRLPAIAFQGTNITAKFIDIHHDGHRDIYLGRNHGDNQPRDLLLLNDGHGFFTLAPDNALPSRYGGRNWGTVSIRAVDFDRDGWPDLINTVYGMNYSEGAVQILFNNRDGTFRDATELILQPAWARYGSLFSDPLAYLDPSLPADFNGDGFIDLLIQGVGQPSRLFLNTGPAGGNRLVEVSELLPESANRFAVADFNGDGRADIAGWVWDCCNPLTLDTWLSSQNFTLTSELIPAIPTGPFFLRGSVLNGASFSADALAPGQLVTIFGRNLGPDTLAYASPEGGAFPNELSGTRVLFGKTAAPIIYSSATQVSAIAPSNLVPQTRADVVVEYQGQQSPPVSIFVASSAPGMFTADSSGGGAAAVLNVEAATGAVTINSPQNPAPRGGIIVAYVTGGGLTNPPSIDGSLAADIGGMALPVQAGLDFISAAGGMGSTDCAANPGCKPVQVLYAGPAPGIVTGVIQVNMRLPDTPSVSGTHSLGVAMGGIWSQSFANVSIR